MPDSRKNTKLKKKKQLQQRVQWVCLSVAALLVVMLAVIVKVDEEKRDATIPPENSPQQTADLQTEEIVPAGENMQTTENEASAQTPQTEETPDAAEPTPIPDADIPLAIYIPISGSQNRRIVNGFGSEWATGRDIDCFEVLLSEEKEEQGSRFYEIFDRLWAAQEDAEDRKIGYELRLTMQDGSVNTYRILKPADTEGQLFEYVECYLYDDIHQNGAWNYYHLLPSTMKETTLMTSVKLHGGKKIDLVADMSLTAFLYRDEGDFDGEGHYVGPNFWTIGIHRK